MDQKLKLRADHWSEGAARVATRQGLQAKSFAFAAEAYSDATGGSMSGDSVRRVTQGFGQRVETQRAGEAAQVYAAEVSKPVEQVVTVQAPILTQANLSTDGGMVLVRDEGWKEAKMSVFSEVTVNAVPPTPHNPRPDPKLVLHHHSYQVGLWDAEQSGQHQYLEGTRRQVAGCLRLSSTNDGAVWIDRITSLNYPRAVQIIDWSHASGHVWTVAKAAFGEGSPQGQPWAEQQVALLWEGRVAQVVTALQALSERQSTARDELRQAPAYFETRQAKMDYALFRQAGYPIGSGTVESGINTVVHHRMKRPGRGWKRANAQAMLAALSELHSGRFQMAWQAGLSMSN